MKKDFYDQVMKDKNVENEPTAKIVQEFRVWNFYELADSISEGAVGFLKFRNNKDFAQYIENLWKTEMEKDH